MSEKCYYECVESSGIGVERAGAVFVLRMQTGENRLNLDLLRAFDAALDQVEASDGDADSHAHVRVHARSARKVGAGASTPQSKLRLSLVLQARASTALFTCR